VADDRQIGKSPTSEDKAIEATRRAIESRGAASLVVSDLTSDDLPNVRWAGSETHLKHVAVALQRVATGAVEYLAVRAPNGFPVSIGGIDYEAHERAGALWQLSTHEALRSLGLGTRLIDQAEARVRQRGFARAVMGVEVDNIRARALYERLGYRPVGHETAYWEAQRMDGSTYTYVAECILLEKELFGVPS
jgi:ribosomal protein S18 acetylase RimI-like enzyme